MVEGVSIRGLIKEGEAFRKFIRLSEGLCDTMTGAEYYSWVTRCQKILVSSYSTNPLTKKFLYASCNNTTENYIAMLRILYELADSEKESSRFETVTGDIGC